MIIRVWGARQIIKVSFECFGSISGFKWTIRKYARNSVIFSFENLLTFKNRVLDLSSFAKFDVTGADAEVHLNRLYANRVARKNGGIVLAADITYDVNEDGIYEDPTGGNNDPLSPDQSYQALLYVGYYQDGPTPCNIADLAEPFGILDLGDIGAFVTAFQAGCPTWACRTSRCPMRRCAR